MCGLISAIAKTPKEAREMVINQYQEQHSRGKEGFGLIKIYKDMSFEIIRATEPVKAMLDLYMSEAEILLFHHRMPTSTDNKIDQTHPIYVSHEELQYDWYIQHNGVISNKDELRRQHEGLGYVYTTLYQSYYQYYNPGPGKNYYEKFNDSESLAIEIARYLEKKNPENQARGANAFMAIRVSKKNNKVCGIYYGRGETNPLEYEERDSGILIASSLPYDTGTSITLKEIKFLTLKNIKKIRKTYSADTFETGVLKTKEYVPVVHSPTTHSHLNLPAKKDDGGTNTNTTTPKTSVTGKTIEVKPEKQSGALAKTDRTIAFEKIKNRSIRDIVDEHLAPALEDLDIDIPNDEFFELVASDIMDYLKERMKGARELKDAFDNLDMAEEMESSTAMSSFQKEIDRQLDEMNIEELEEEVETISAPLPGKVNHRSPEHNYDPYPRTSNTYKRNTPGFNFGR